MKLETFDTASCGETTGTQPAEPATPLACYELSFDTTSCTWKKQGTQPAGQQHH
jgi:hypothetical protein